MDITPILLDLEIIKQIQKNNKLAINILPGCKKLFVDTNEYLTSSINRWYYGYNREDSIEYLENLTQQIEKICEFILEGAHTSSAQVLKIAIKEAINGLNNLKNTYIKDSISVAKLTLINNKLTNFVSLLENVANISMSVINNIENNEIIKDNKNNYLSNTNLSNTSLSNTSLSNTNLSNTNYNKTSFKLDESILDESIINK